MTRQELKTRLIGSFNNPDIYQSVRGDYNLSQTLISSKHLIPAAVLVPVVDRPHEMTLLFTQRTQNLTSHPGQISFPGGHTEPSDKNANDTALRESEEEVGLKRSTVEVVGRLNPYLTRTGFSVTPIVGIVDSTYKARPDPQEVAEVFEVPLDFFLDLNNYHQRSYIKNGDHCKYHAIPYNNYYIWGATAGILKSFHDILVR